MTADQPGAARVLDRVWADVTGTQPPLETSLVLVTAGLAAIAVLAPGAWRRSRHVLTIVHEAGHALVAVATGRRLSGIRLHSDTSGLTVSRGRSRGPGMVLTALAGYPAPALLGYGAALLLAQGRSLAVLWLAVLLLAGLLVWVRNLFGLLLVLVAGAALGAVTWWGRELHQSLAAWTLTWFLLVGSARPVAEMQASRRGRRAGTSDADVLARLTGLPGAVWALLMLAVTLACLAGGAALLL